MPLSCPIRELGKPKYPTLRVSLTRKYSNRLDRLASEKHSGVLWQKQKFLSNVNKVPNSEGLLENVVVGWKGFYLKNTLAYFDKNRNAELKKFTTLTKGLYWLVYGATTLSVATLSVTTFHIKVKKKSVGIT